MRTYVLAIGIDTYPAMPLEQCKNDMHRMTKLFREVYGIPRRDIATLADADATAANIRLALCRIIGRAKPGDQAVICYSGHGAQVAESQVEQDGIEEALCPVDFDWRDPDTWIRDDELRAILDTAAEGVDMTLILDCCFAAGQYRAARGIRGVKAPSKTAVWRRVQRLGRKGSRVYRIGQPRAAGDPIRHLVLSACAEQETAAELPGGGAFTLALCRKMSKSPDAAARTIYRRVCKAVDGQTPQIAGPAAKLRIPILCT